jgi:hypothetical protein
VRSAAVNAVDGVVVHGSSKILGFGLKIQIVVKVGVIDGVDVEVSRRW